MENFYIVLSIVIVIGIMLGLDVLFLILLPIHLKLRKQYKEVKASSITDPVTGLFNTRYLHQRLQEEMSRAKRFGDPPYLLFIDLDGFKVINDSFGHSEGDKMLVKVAAVLKETMRRNYDIIVRNGGDEFVILAAGVGMGSADINKIAEKIRLAIKNDLSYPVTASIGLHHINTRETMDEVLKMADRAMYEAKRQGKDRVCVSDQIVTA